MKLIFINRFDVDLRLLYSRVETKMEGKFLIGLLVLGLVSTALGKFRSKFDIRSVVRVVAERKKTKLTQAQAN